MGAELTATSAAELKSTNGFHGVDIGVGSRDVPLAFTADGGSFEDGGEIANRSGGADSRWLKIKESQVQVMS